MDLAFRSIAELSAALAARELDAVALVRHVLERIDGQGQALNAFVTVLRDPALREAEAAVARAAAGRRRSALDGIPIAIKDNIDLAGVPTGNGFGGTEPWRVPEADAEVVRRLREAGAIVVGKLGMHEGALGATNDNPHTGRVANPHHVGFTPGGSSGGSGAAVGAGLCCAALGTDTGGSVRIPAAYCGVVGFKGSFGLASTRGVVPLSYRLDHVGPLTRTVGDAALMIRAMAGFDPACPESRPLPVPALEVPAGLQGVRLGVLGNFADEPAEPAVQAAFLAARATMERLGATIETIDLPSYEIARGRRAGFVRVEVDAAFVHGELCQREPERFSPDMRGYIAWGLKATAQQVLQADRRIDLAAFELGRAWAACDAIISPTTPQVAFPFGSKVPDNQGGYTILANFAGCPAISLPMGTAPDGMPIGLQIMAPVGRDDRALAIAAAYEAARGPAALPAAPMGPF